MTNRPTYIDYATPTPASEQSNYFDAPIMIWNKKQSTPDLTASPTQDEPVSGADVARQPSVAMSRIPNSRSAKDDAEYSDADHKASHRANRASGTSAASDEGYGSAKPLSRRSSAKSIPVVWDESADADTRRSFVAPRGGGADGMAKRAASMRSFGARIELDGEGDGRSVRTSPSVLRRRRVSLSGGSFASGAGTVGPAATPDVDDAFHRRRESADAGLTPKERAKLSKAQAKEGKLIARVIKKEGATEKKALEEAIAELSDLQRFQKAAGKQESKTYASYSRALREFNKAELEFLAARARYERAQADLQAQEDAKDAARSHAQEATEMLQAKNREVEWLRAQKAVDDRERAAKLRELAGKA